MDGALSKAVRKSLLAESIDKYRPKVFPSPLSLSLGSTNDRWVLIRTIKFDPSWAAGGSAWGRVAVSGNYGGP